MGLTNAWNVATTSLATNAGLTSIVSRNISNAQNSTGYVSAKVANLVTGSNGAATILSISDLTNATLFNSMLSSTSANRRRAGAFGRRHAIAADGQRRHDDKRCDHRRAIAVDAAAGAVQRLADLFVVAGQFVRRRRRADRRAESGQRPELRERDRGERARDGGSGHGQFGRDHQFAAGAVPGTSTRRSSRERRPAPTFPTRSTSATRSCKACRRQIGDHDDDECQRVDVDLYRQRRDPVRHVRRAA